LVGTYVGKLYRVFRILLQHINMKDGEKSIEIINLLKQNNLGNLISLYSLTMFEGRWVYIFVNQLGVYCYNKNRMWPTITELPILIFYITDFCNVSIRRKYNNCTDSYRPSNSIWIKTYRSHIDTFWCFLLQTLIIKLLMGKKYY